MPTTKTAEQFLTALMKNLSPEAASFLKTALAAARPKAEQLHAQPGPAAA